MRTCRKCWYPIEPVPGFPGEYVVVSDDTGDGLSYCPPDPDARKVSRHIPAREERP
jgi:hypothetical protein